MTRAVPDAFAHAAERHFGRALPFAARAPGRVNLIGEHTDYNGGLVLPCAIERSTTVLAAPREDGRVRVWAADLDEEAAFEAAAPARQGSFVDYVQGVFAALAERGPAPGGFDLAIASDVPREAGLSSSAALGVAVATVLDHAAGLGLGPLERGRVAHRGESHFVGVGCGILDPWASALAREGRLLRIDCASESVAEVPFPAEHARLLIAHSGVRRALGLARDSAGGEGERGYGDRVGECAEALLAARAHGLVEATLPSASALTAEEVDAIARSAVPAHLARRLRHVVSENDRVRRVVAALEQVAAGGDPDAGLEAVGACLREGQASLRDDFEVSIPELDVLCADADAHPGCFGSRLTGAGFGGCTLHLVRRDAAREVADAIATGFEARFGRRPELLETAPGAGAGPLPVGADAGAPA